MSDYTADLWANIAVRRWHYMTVVTKAPGIDVMTGTNVDSLPVDPTPVYGLPEIQHWWSVR